MSQCPAGLLVASLLATACLASTAYAQSASPIQDGERRLQIGGDVSAVWGRRDNDAFFNYTDYEHNALRLTRLRLAGEWRIGRGWSLLTQLQTENTDSFDAVAAYVRWRAHGVAIQAGRIPPVVGAYGRRAYGTDNAVIGTPLAYQYLTSLRPDALPDSMDDVLRMRGRGWQPFFPVGSFLARAGIPLLSTRWDTGVEASWRRQILDLSGAVTMGAPAQPRVQATNDGRQWSGRAAVHLASGLTAGLSGARGSWLDRRTLALVAPDRRESSQSLLGADAEYGRGPWLFRAEWIRTVYAVPVVTGPPPVARLVAASGFAEMRYRVRARWNLGLRLERLTFSSVQNALGASRTWDAPVSRVEAALGFRVRRTIDLRGGWQYDWRDGGRVHERGYPALQLVTWF